MCTKLPHPKAADFRTTNSNETRSKSILITIGQISCICILLSLLVTSCSKIKKYEVLGTIKKPVVKPPYKFTDMGIAFKGMDSTQPLTGTHSSWPHANVAYDKSTDKFIVFYDIKEKHVLVNNRVAMRYKNPDGGFSKLVVVADRMREGISCKTQSSGIAKNGDYISLVANFQNSNGAVLGTCVYRSKDKGKTWSYTDMKADGAVVKAFNGDVTGFLVLKSGRILTLACHPTTRQTRMLYSDDNGATWKFGSIPTCYDRTEPGWCELSDGTIVCYLRQAVVGVNFATKNPAYFTRSFDGGRTWELPVPSKSVLNMTGANGHLFLHEDTQTVDFIHHSRFTESDGHSSILQSSGTEEELKNDKLGKEVRIVKLPNQNKGGDSGYMGGVKSDKGVINVFYYAGTMTNAEICYLAGRRE